MVIVTCFETEQTVNRKVFVQFLTILHLKWSCETVINTKTPQNTYWKAIWRVQKKKDKLYLLKLCVKYNNYLKNSVLLL